ncbi:hypothetical protein RHMOL_Rhmol06G0032700 [Rhododendron molle]|uniref:Uncharacterized protein n=1 Tax=Rhododendron molle TaxID=49168 RepID=A0ACC0N9K9_RHOML|nr:hypothetical protein RHMOL_Rhmol06G0032700 [Rhododendron molle]
MSSIGEADMATASTLRTEDDAMESDAMSEPGINLSDEEEENEVTVGSKSKGRPESVVWAHFERVTRKGQVKPDRAKCKHAYKWLSGNGTSTLKKHMLRYFADFLKKFYDATLHLSGSSYATSNMYFNEVMAVDEFLSSFLKDVYVMYDGDERNVSRDALVTMARKMKKKFDKYWGKVEKMNMMMFIAIVLDPRFKLKYVTFCFSELFHSDLEKELTQMIRDVLDRAFVEYEKLNEGAPFSSQSSYGMEVDQPNRQNVSLQNVSLHPIPE